MIGLRHKIKVKGGKVEFLNLPLFNRDLKQYEGRDAFVVLHPYKDKRSQNQNRYYWGVVMKLLSDELGYLPDEMHEVMKQKFLNVRDVKVGTVKYQIPESTTKLTTTDFEDYVSKIRIWAAKDLNVMIPLPNEAEF